MYFHKIIKNVFGVSNLNQQIVVWDENRVKIGNTFPRRAKQLVNKKKAVWLDETHTEILLISEDSEGSELNSEIVNFANNFFENTAHNSKILNLKDELIASLNAKYESLISEGLDKEKALSEVINDKDSIDKFIQSLSRKKSIVKDAYRDKASVVLHSAPFEIIKKSKKRTRELHLAFSAVLWFGASIIYFSLSYILGYRSLSRSFSELSWTWLIFILAAIIECSVEIYFSKKELDVLNENIDLRQINPLKKDGDLDLRKYQKSLTRKIKVMSKAVFWISLIFIYFIAGYAFNLWNVAWIIFVIGIFYELLRNFLKKLKEKFE